MKTVFLFVFLSLSGIVKSQSVDISFHLKDSCIDISRQLHIIQITFQNNTKKDIWVDLSAIKFEIYLEGKIVEPFDLTIIGAYSPEGILNHNGFVRVKKANRIFVFQHSSFFQSYQLEKNKEYSLKCYYKDARKKLFNLVDNMNRDIGETNLRICE